jgi:hypothetical protein
MSAARDDGHCGGPECFRNDGGAIDVCACSCERCAEAIRRLLLEQGEGDDHGDPSGNGSSPAY